MVPQLVSKRVLELLGYLCRHHSKVPAALVLLPAPELGTVAAAAAARRDTKGAFPSLSATPLLAAACVQRLVATLPHPASSN